MNKNYDGPGIDTDILHLMEDRCPECGAELDTGYECNGCGKDYIDRVDEITAARERCGKQKAEKNERAYYRIQKLTNAELANEILEKIWSKYPMGSEAGLMIEAAVDRLR